MVPRKFFLTCGSGVDSDPIISFGLALQSAGIAQFNLVKVSSIIPPGCELIPKEEGIKLLSPGQIVYCVLAKQHTQDNELITAGIGAAIASDQNNVGCLYELTGVGESKTVLSKEVERLAAELLSQSIGVELSHTLHIAIQGMGKKSVYTTVIAAAIFA